MSKDAVIDAIDRVEHAAAQVHVAVDAVADELARAGDLRRQGATMSTVVRQLLDAGGRELRLRPAEASAELERAISAYRTAGIRELVDTEGMTFTEVAALTGVSRQMVARLYKAGSASSHSEPPRTGDVGPTT